MFDKRERAALDFAESVTRSDRRVEPAVRRALRKHFSDDAIVELTGLISFQNMSSKFISALDVPPQGFCRLPMPNWPDQTEGTKSRKAPDAPIY